MTTTEHNQRWEENLSALMDGELSGQELLESIDALVEGQDLREFWRQARSLEKGLNRQEAVLHETPPERIWETVELEVQQAAEMAKMTEETGRIVPIRRWSPQTWVAAASIILVLSVGGVGLLRNTIPQPVSARTVEIGSKSMTEDRFIELTSELLMADSRYHRKMLEVMQTVNREIYGGGGAGTAQEALPRSEEGRGDSPELNAGETSPSESSERQDREDRQFDSDRPVRLNLW